MMQMRSDGPIHTRREGAVLEVTLDRPKANAIDLATSRIMGEVFRDFRDDDSLRVAILRAAGDKFFCPGWDLNAAAEGDAVDADYGVGGFGGLQELPHLNKPVIAAVNGICCGGGLELALSCDLILASDTATFALPEIRSGTVADAASIKLPKRIPYHAAMDLLLTGRWFDAHEAMHWGLLREITTPADLLLKAWALARMQAAMPMRFAERLATWSQPVARHALRLYRLRPEIGVLSLGGAVGDRAALADDANAIAAEMAAGLGLYNPPKAQHAMRDHIADYANLLSLVTGSLGKMGQDICLMAQQGIEEISLQGGGGSSAMPHKHNPILAELLISNARFNATQLAGMHHALIHEHERSGAAWVLEWMILPQMAAVTARSLSAAQDLCARITRIG